MISNEQENSRISLSMDEKPISSLWQPLNNQVDSDEEGNNDRNLNLSLGNTLNTYDMNHQLSLLKQDDP